MSAPKCPICGKPVEPEHRPFCSKRCADLDLHRWLGGHYAIPGPEDPDSVPEEPGDD
ncbi:MAG TPA: DNA gyrase inhibitor YacG [Phenylobacterium sp.]|uniref:DNA gyrase inhibitor YacG n=1 Tax=Phenylobacterium sp. TaxID=1871053 RepID=UPI002BA5CB34|nr:DNA gyrase inhibitor YacG [Phenylobacterium sp.]HXA40290.1 DNA gyrase inhibitor YacG [Phenylobacterium sp.]